MTIHALFSDISLLLGHCRLLMDVIVATITISL